MKIIKITQTIAFFALMIGFVSCNDLLDVDNDLIVSEEENFNNETDVNASLLGAYVQLQDVAQQVVLLNECRAAYLELTPEGSSDNDIATLHNNNASKENAYTSVKPFYQVIQTCNDIIAKVPGVMPNDPSFTQQVADHYMAEAIGIRGWTYFQLVKLYGNVNYTEKSIDKSSGKAETQPMDLQQLVQKLIDTETMQLKKFSEKPVADYSTEWRRSRFGQFAAYAFLSELHLFQAALNKGNAESDYEKVIEYCGVLMNLDSVEVKSQKFKLGNLYGKENGENIFKSMTGNSDEAIFAVDYTKTYKQQHYLQKIFHTNPFFRFNATFSNLWESDDRRFSISVDSDTRKIRKYVIGKKPFDDDAPILLYRAAEIHLMYAEALNALGKSQEALDLMNNGNARIEYTPTGEKKYNAESLGVRGRQKLPPINIVYSSMEELQQQVLASIKKERMRELAFEGKYWQDKIRYALLAGENNFMNGNKTVSEDKWYFVP